MGEKLEIKDSEIDAIKKYPNFHKKIINTAQSIILILDPNGKIIDFNPYMEKITGYKIEEVKGKDWFDMFLPGRDHDKIRKLFKKAIGEIQTKGNVNPILTKEGKEILIEWHDKTLKDKNGSTIGLLCIGQNVTERIKAEKELKKSKEKYKFLYENSLAINIVYDRQSKIVDTNKAFLNLLGYKREEVIGHSIAEFVPPEEHEKMFKAAQADFKPENPGKITPGIEFPIIAKDKSVHHIYYTGGDTLVYEKGKLVGNLITGIDITDRKKVEEEKEKLQEKLKKYAKKLEIKVKRLEKDRIRLTKNEKKVLWGITRYPYSSDIKLAEKLGLNRSTVTAIRNRLKNKGLYALKNIPNFKALGSELLTVIYGRLNKPFEKLNKDLKEKYQNIKSIHSFFTENEFMCMIVSKDMADFEKQIKPFRKIINSKTVFKKIDFIHLFSKINKIYRVADFSDLLGDLFNIGKRIKENKEIKDPDRELSKNEKKVLITMVEYPGLSSYDMSFKINLTRTTISKIKKRLIKGGFIDTKVIPNFKKLGLNLLTLVHTKHSASFEENKNKSLLKKNPHAIFYIGGTKEAVSLSVFKDYNKYKMLDKKINSDNKIFLGSPSVFHSTTNEIKINKLNFLDTAKCLVEK